MLSQYFTVVFLILYSNSVTCQGNSTLVYVIDHTTSMIDDLSQVQIGSELILSNVLKAKSSEIANIALVTFHDPDVKLLTVTRDPNVFKKALSSITLDGYNRNGQLNVDSPEYSMSGMIEGLERSLPNSYMYVFTDAPAKDGDKTKEVLDLCMKKQTQIFIIVTYSRYEGVSNPKYVFKKYYDVAEKCNGQVIYINKDDISKFIGGFTETISDPKSVMVRKTILKQDLATPIQFNLDDKVDYATVFLSGRNVHLEVGRNNFEDKVKTTQQMWTNNAKILKVFNTVPGIYEAKIKGTSDVTITVYAKSDFIFKHGFTENQPKSFVDASTRPIAGEKQRLVISVTDPDHGVTIKQINILSTKEDIIMTIPLKHIDGDFYITDKFVSPNSPFIIQVKGTSKQTWTTVLRNSRTVIEPIPAEKPVIGATIDKVRVLEKHEVKISCSISQGLPRPTITWKLQKNGQSHNTPLAESTVDLTIKEVNLADAGKYICIATNTLGSDQAKTELEVTKIPKVSVQEKSILVEYGSTNEFNCIVVAHPQPKIVWKDQLGNVLNAHQVTKNRYEFTSRLTVLNIRNPSQYTCYAENGVGRNSETVSVSTKPAFDVATKFEETTKVKYGKPVNLVCDIKSALPIERAWFSDKERELLQKGISKENNAKEFFINFMDIGLQGRYGCKVWLKSDSNMSMEQHTTLVIDDLSPPSVTVTQNISNKIFTASCLTKGIPKPTVSWYYAKDKKEQFSNLEVTGEELKIHDIKLKHTGYYKCIAENAVGKHEEITNLVVKEPPHIITDKTNYIALVGDSVLGIPCNVTGYPDPTIVWKNNDHEIIATDSKYEVKKILDILHLRIKNPSLKDTSSFICEASNYLGNESKPFDIFVTDNFYNNKNFYGNIHTVYILENDDKDIKCNLPHLNSTSVRWYKNGLLTNTVGTYYSIEKASVSDDGNYTCRANEESGSMSETYAVDVGTRPIFNIAYDSSVLYWWGDDNNYVDCSLKSSKALDQHHSKVEWSYNGKKTNAEGYKYHVLRWGQYSCKVSNVFGSTERSINVTTDGCLLKRKVDINNNPPLILSFNVDFESQHSMDVVNKYLFMEMEQTMLISCHNSNDENQFTISNDQYLRAQCLGEDRFIINKNVFKYSDLKCEKPVKVTIDSTKRICTHARSELIKVGFNIDSGEFIEMYRVCFDNELKVPIFTFTEMAHGNLGNEIDYKKWVNIPNYQGVTSIDCDNESKCCYAKGQLINAVDVGFGPPQAATFYDYNAVGVWKPCKNESRISWGLIEERLRILLSSYYSFQVWSGTSEYEQQDVGIVPRYLWKAINSYGVIVYVNNPKPTLKDIKCSSSINNYTILNRVINHEDPFTYLCDIDEFSKLFNIPRDSFEHLRYYL